MKSVFALWEPKVSLITYLILRYTSHKSLGIFGVFPWGAQLVIPVLTGRRLLTQGTRIPSCLCGV